MNELRLRQKIYRLYHQSGRCGKAAVRGGLRAFYCLLHQRLSLNYDLTGAIVRFRPGASDAEKASLKRQMRRDCARYLANPEEFFLYHFDEISERKKSTFLTYDRRGTYTLLLNEPETARFLTDKGKTFDYFGKYYGRDLLRVTKTTKDETVLDFINERKRVIVKAADGSMGKGIKLLNRSDFDSPQAMLAAVRRCGPCVVEDVLQAEATMSALHPQSLNTVRTPVFLERDGSVRVFHPCLRVGRGDSVVDNAGSGGVFANIDAVSGVVITDAVDEYGRTYQTHPDTGFRFKGMQIPKWDELLSLARELALVLPSVRFIGFDLALTENGWVMVEGNRNPQPIQQMVDQVGLRAEFDEMLKRL